MKYQQGQGLTQYWFGFVSKKDAFWTSICYDKILLNICYDKILLNICYDKILLNICYDKILLNICYEKRVAFFVEIFQTNWLKVCTLISQS